MNLFPTKLEIAPSKYLPNQLSLFEVITLLADELGYWQFERAQSVYVLGIYLG